MKNNNPELSSAPGNCQSSVSSSTTADISVCTSKSPDILSQLLVLPKPQKTTRQRKKPALNSKTVCTSFSEVLDKKEQELEKAETESLRKAMQLEREQKKLSREEKRNKTEKQKKLKGKKSLKNSQTKHVLKQEYQEMYSWLKSKPKTTLKKDMIRKVTRNMAEKFTVHDNELTSDEDDAICP